MTNDASSRPKRFSQRRLLLKNARVPQRRGRPSAKQAADLRAIYLDAALQTFLNKGYERTTIEEIARVAKAGKITLYKQFGNKEGLFRLVVNEAIAKTRERLAVGDEGNATPDEVLLQVVRHLYDGFTNPYLLAVRRLVVSEYQRFPELARELRSHNRELLSSVEEYLRRATESGYLNVPDARAGALQLSTLASGGMRFLISEPITDPAKKEFWIRAVCEFARNSWRPDRAPTRTPTKKKRSPPKDHRKK